MKESKEITAKLSPTDEFSQFQITFYPNIKDYAEYYDSSYADNNCLFIEIEAITELYSFEDYNVKNKDHQDFANEIPEEDSKLIFSLLRNRLNQYLEVLNVRTKMFWIEDLPINPLSMTIGKASQSIYLCPNQLTKSSHHIWEKLWDNYQTEIETEPKQITPIDKSIINESDNLVVIGYPWRNYINKARIALFESEFYEFIIYCSIAAESFIKQVTAPNMYGLEKDIVLKKLIRTGNNRIIDSYYNIILKYLFGKSLIEVNQELYNNLDTIYKFRNALMHSGEIDSKAFKSAGHEGIEELTFEMCEYMLHSLQNTITTVLGLITKNVK